jgi:outer membrane protein assembly factor BamB
MHRGLRRSSVVVLLGACLLQGSLSAGEWPTYRGDVSRSGATDDEVRFPLQQVWTSRAPAVPRLAWSSAEGRVIEDKLMGHRIRFDDAFRTVVSEGRVYFGSTVDHQVHCLDLESGETLWTFVTGGPVRLAPTVDGDRVLFGSDDGRVYCLDKRDGSLRWQRQVAADDQWLLARGEMISKWPVRTGVLVMDGIAYYGAGIFPHEDIYLEGVDVSTGQRVWRADNISAQDAGRDDVSPQGYLLASDKMLFVPSGGSLPAAFNRADGTLVHKRNHSWRTTAGGVVGGSRAVLADGQLYASGPHHFLAMEEATGDVGFAWVEGRQLSIQQDAAYIVTGTRVARLDRIPYAENSRERQRLELEIYSANRSIRGASGEKRTELQETIDAAKARLDEIAAIGIAWETASEDDMSLLVSGGHVFVGGPNRVTAYRKSDGEQVWQQDVEGAARGLALVDDHLLVSTDAGVITCFASGETATQDSPREHLQGAEGDLAGEEIRSEEVFVQAAEEILQQTGVDDGFALVLGSEQGDLAMELARQSELKIYCVETDSEKVQRSRERLKAAGLYGRRVTVHQWDHFDAIPYANYFANLIVSEELIRTGRIPDGLEQVARHLKPAGGMICLGIPAGAGSADTDALVAALNSLELAAHSEVAVDGGYAVLTRGLLPGAGNWSHQYGNPDNTAVSRDTRIKGDLGVLWYGDPGPDQMVNRHEGAVGPLAVDGRLFVQGETSIMAYDAYNGAHLWTQENPEAIRTGVFQNQNPGNLAAGAGSLFHFIGDKCFQLDMADGELVATHSLPAAADEGQHQWGYVAIHDGILYGTATRRKELDARLRRRGRVTEEATDSIFAIDIASGEHLWDYQGQNISHHTIAIGEDKVCFIDSSLTAEQREELLRQDKDELAGLTGEERELAEQRLKEADVRMAVAVGARNGAELWAHPVDVTDCSDIGIGGGKLTMMFADGKLVLCGANANGHYWKQFMDGEFKRRRIVVLSADNGYKIWGRDANYLHRPIVIGKQLLAEPWMYDLETGEQITRNHPVSGLAEPWSMMRTGHHCGMVTACDSGMLLFRSGFTGFADLNQDEGIRHFSGHRLGCWINAIAAGGLVMIPEASAGCVCQFSLASTIVLEPREPRRPWTVFSAVGELTPVEHLSVNLGAPGDRKDALGRLWLSYPRYTPYKKTSLEVEFDLQPEFASTEGTTELARVSSLFSGGVQGKGFHNISPDASPALDTDRPWIYQSWAEDLTALELPLIGADDDPAQYTIRLHFADLREDSSEATEMRVIVGEGAGAREVPVRLDPAGTEPLQPTVVEVENLVVSGNVKIRLEASNGKPLLNAVEAIRQR